MHDDSSVSCAVSGLSRAFIIFNFRFPEKCDPTVISLSSLSSVIFPVFHSLQELFFFILAVLMIELFH